MLKSDSWVIQKLKEMEQTRYPKICILELMNFARLRPDESSINWFLQVKNRFDYFDLETILFRKYCKKYRINAHYCKEGTKEEGRGLF